MENNNTSYETKVTIRGANIIYLLAMLLFITVGAFAQTRSFQYGILITEFLIVALPVLVFVWIKKGSLKQELRFNKLHLVDAFLVIMIFAFGYPVAIFVNLIGNIFLSIFGKLIQSPIPMANNFNEYFVLLLLVAGSAGLCEELLFRGLVLRGYEKLGKWKGIIFTAVLFAVLHINIQNTLGPLFLGILLGYVVYTTNSIFAGMLGHFFNNSLSVTIGYLLMKLPMAQGASTREIPRLVMLQGLIGWAFIIGMWACVSGLMLYFCMQALKKINLERKAGMLVEEEQIQFPSLRGILKNAKISWPLYISAAVFVFYSVLEFTYMVTGKSLFNIIF